MRKLCQMLLSVAAVSALLLAPATAVWAQAEKTVAVVSIESIDKLFADVDYLAEAADQAGAVQMVKGTAGPFMDGIDKSKPLGAVVTTDGDAFKVISFIPVTNLKQFLDGVKIFVGEAEDAGDGILKVVGGDQTVFVKESGGYAFMAQSPDHLSNLPADPTQWLDGLGGKYAFAVRGYMQGVPQSYRDMAVGFINEGMSAAMQRQPGEDAAMYAFRKRMATVQVDQIKTLMAEMDNLTIGWAIDSQAQQTYLDFEVTAVPGTELAQQMALAAEGPSKFGGFARDGAAMLLQSVSKISASDIEQTTDAMKAFRLNTESAIEKQNHGPAGEKALKDVVGTFFDVLDATIKGGKMDLGATVLLDENAFFVGAGMLVAEGEKLEEGLRKLAELAKDELAQLAKDEPDFQGVKFDADSHAGVSFHTMAIPVPAHEEEARAMFGEALDVVVGTSDSSFYVAAGKDAAATLKMIIDDSADKAAIAVLPTRMVISLIPIMKYAAQFAPPAEQMADMLAEGGKDKISMVQKSIQNGVQMRISLEEGVIKAMGAVSTMFGGAAEDFGDEPPAEFDGGF